MSPIIDEKDEKIVPEIKKRERTKAQNNQLVLRSLAGIAILCTTVSGAALIAGVEPDFYEMTFAPVSMIVAGLLVFIKN